jgi:hypothetical protein
MTATAGEPGAVPVTFRLTTYWKRGRDEHGITRFSTRRIDLHDALGLILGQLPDDAMTVELNEGSSDVTTIVIDWARVPDEIRSPFEHGVRRT